MRPASVARYLAYPCNSASLIFILIASLLLAAATSVGVFGWPLAGIVLLALMRYGVVMQTVRMVHIARDGGDRPTARALLRDFRSIFPNDPLQPVADALTRQLER